MGISNIEFTFLTVARDAGYFRDIDSVLEFGESNTHNLDIVSTLRSLLPAGAELDSAISEARSASAEKLPGFPWARLLYRIMLNCKNYVAVDLEPKPPTVIQQDLNLPFDLGTRFDLCINNGTSEHIFNQSNLQSHA